MTTPRINLSSAELVENSTFTTSDGKLVTLKHVCIEAPKPRIDLSKAKLGDTIVTRSGLHGLITRVSTTPGGKFDTEHAWYFEDGRASIGGSEYDAVELIPKPEERVSIENAGLGSRVRLRNGEVVTVSSLWSTAADKCLSTYSFFDNGERCNHDKNYDVVEILELKPIESKVSLKGIFPGSRVTLRNGEVYIFRGKTDHGTYRLSKGENLDLYFYEDGQCNLREKELDAVKVEVPKTKDLISIAVEKIGKENVDRVVLGSIAWEKFREEVPNVPAVVDDIYVRYNHDLFGADIAIMLKDFQ